VTYGEACVFCALDKCTNLEFSDDHACRRRIWEDHVAFIANHNREHDMGLHTFTVGLNKYADMVSVMATKLVSGRLLRHEHTLHSTPSRTSFS